MFKPLFVATSLLLAATPALAGPAGDTLKTALYAGALDDGLQKLQPMAASGDTEAAFGVGTIKLTLALQHFVQTLYKHGFDLPNGRAAGIAGPSIPQNPSPEPFDYAGVRSMLATFVTELDDARASFDAAGKSGDYVIEINPFLVRIDANGDGKVDADESLAGLTALWSHTSLDDVLSNKSGTMPKSGDIGFDRADAFWLAGYTEVAAAQADFLLAHDFSSFVNATFHRFFPKAGFPMRAYGEGGQLMFDPDTDASIADLIGAIHTISWPVADSAKLSGVRDRLKATIAYSRQDWDAILAETDGNRELLPSPKQTALVPDVAITDERVAAWRATLDEADKILDGTLLVPHWRFKRGFDLKAYFTTAKKTDLVMLLTGLDAVPYLKDGPIASTQDFRAIQTAFGNDWLGYAFWFN
jgi:hypothetical protein